MTVQMLKTLTASLMVAALIVTTVAVPQRASANALDNEMGAMFDGVMSNSTQPGTIESARRGGWSGGAFTARSKIMSVRPMSLVNPDFNAGCGGIDLTGGSFSFINADQFVEFAKTVAQNAVGYAFMLALESFMPSVRQTISQLQDMVTEMNQMFSNSCQTAKQGVDAIAESETFKAASETVSDGTGDLYQSWTSADGQDPTEEQRNNEDLYSNLMWKSLQDQRVANWFQYGDEQFLEIMMNATGTVIIGGLREPTDLGSAPVREILPGGNITLIDLVDPERTDQEVSYRPCVDTNQCLELGEPRTVSIEGYADRAEVIMMEILDRIYAGSELDDDHQRFISALPAPVPAMFFRLSRMGPNMARSWARDFALPIGVSLAYETLSEVHRGAAVAANMSNNAWADELRDTLTESRQTLYNDYEVLMDKHGTIRDAMDEYTQLLESMPKSGMQSPGYAGGSD